MMNEDQCFLAIEYKHFCAVEYLSVWSWMTCSLKQCSQNTVQVSLVCCPQVFEYKGNALFILIVF